MRLTISAIAVAVWNLIAVASRTVTVTTNSDKTGYSLTAGSYSVRASSSQRVSGAINSTTNSLTISSVTTTRATAITSNQSSDSGGAGSFYEGRISAATTVAMDRSTAPANNTGSCEVFELF